MDIIALFAADMVRLDELILRKPYPILYIKKFRTVDGQQTLKAGCLCNPTRGFQSVIHLLANGEN